MIKTYFNFSIDENSEKNNDIPDMPPLEGDEEKLKEKND